MNKAFFLDRDGTINIDFNFVHQPAEWTWCDRAIDALKWIKDHDFKLIIVTNQSGIARERYSEEDVLALHNWVDNQLKEHHIKIDDWYFAAHHPKYDADEKFLPADRKPGTGMFRKAANKHDIDFSHSYMAGDKISDLKPAIELGITPFFIRSRHEPRQDKEWLNRHNIDSYETLWDAIQELSKTAYG